MVNAEVRAARELARRAETAQRELAELSQSQLDAIVEAAKKRSVFE